MILAVQPHAISRKTARNMFGGRALHWRPYTLLAHLLAVASEAWQIIHATTRFYPILELLSRRSFRLDGSIGAGVVAGGYMETQVRFVAASPPAKTLGIVGMIPWEVCTIGPILSAEAWTPCFWCHGLTTESQTTAIGCSQHGTAPPARSAGSTRRRRRATCRSALWCILTQSGIQTTAFAC